MINVVALGVAAVPVLVVGAAMVLVVMTVVVVGACNARGVTGFGLFTWWCLYSVSGPIYDYVVFHIIAL